MKNLSVFQVILLAAFSALAIAGILIFALFVGGAGTNAIGAVTIWGPLEPSAFSVVLRQVAENDGRLSQVRYEQKDPATYVQTLTDALASGGGPDLFLMTQDQVVRDAGKVVPVSFAYLSEPQFRDTFVESADPYLSQNGVLGIPLLADPLVMYWNRDMLSTAGFAQPPRYWSDLAEVAERTVKRTDAGGIQKAAVAFGEYANVNNAKDILATLILQAGGVITARDNTGKLIPALSARTGVSTSQAAESALRFYSEFADPSKTTYSWNRSLAEARAAFSAGDLALYFGYASEEPLIARMNPNLNFAAAPLPQVKGAARSITAAKVYALAITRTSPNALGAQTVATVIASRDVSQLLSTALGIPSARRDVLSQPVLEGNDDLFNRQAIVAKSWMDPDPAKTDGIFRAMIESVTSGTLRLSEAIQRADQEMAAALGL